MLRQLAHLARTLSTLLFVIASLFLTIAGQVSSQEQPPTPIITAVNQTITTDTTWTLANSPYDLTTDLEIQSGATLTIEPGVEVWFHGKYYIHVRPGSSIIAKGTPTQHITIGRFPGSLRWKKIWFHENTTSYLRYVDIAGGGSAGEGDDTLLHYEGPGTHVLNNCTVQDGKQQGIVASGGGLNLTVAGTLFQGNGRRPIMADSGANVTATGSTFDTDDNIAIYLRQRTVPPTIVVHNSNFLANHSAIVVYNEMANSACIDAQDNWWGAANGPADSSAATDACGLGTHNGNGSAVTNGVDYRNWLAAATPRTGITTPPVAAFTVTPDPDTWQPPSTTYTFDASTTTDAEDYTSSLDVCWDWDNDGTCDTAWSAAKITTHSFATGGVQTVRLVARDTDGDTGETTRAVHVGIPPTAAFTYTLPTWAQARFDASASSDDMTPDNLLQATWDWEGDGVTDTPVVSTTEVQTHTYLHVGRYWPTLSVRDTDNLTGTLTKILDIVPLPVTTTISGSGGTLTSTDLTVRIDLYTNTISGDVISNGLTITHTPWVSIPHANPTGIFAYQGFDLNGRPLAGGAPLTTVNGIYTITVGYNYYGDHYITDVLGWPFEQQLRLYRWAEETASWAPVTSTLYTDTEQLIATTPFFGRFALILDVTRLYLPLVAKSY